MDGWEQPFVVLRRLVSWRGCGPRYSQSLWARKRQMPNEQSPPKIQLHTMCGVVTHFVLNVGGGSWDALHAGHLQMLRLNQDTNSTTDSARADINTHLLLITFAHAQGSGMQSSSKVCGHIEGERSSPICTQLNVVLPSA